MEEKENGDRRPTIFKSCTAYDRSSVLPICLVGGLSSTSRPAVPTSPSLSTVGNCAFEVSLSLSLVLVFGTSCQKTLFWLSIFRRRLKTFLFLEILPADIRGLWFDILILTPLFVLVCHSGHSWFPVYRWLNELEILSRTYVLHLLQRKVLPSLRLDTGSVTDAFLLSAIMSWLTLWFLRSNSVSEMVKPTLFKSPESQIYKLFA